VRAPVLHLRDLGVGIAWARPIVIGRLLLPLAIKPGQRFPRRRFDSGLRGQADQKLLVVLTGVSAHDAPHGRVGFQRRGVDPHRLAHEQTIAGYPFQHPGEDPLVRLHVDQAPRTGNRRMIGRRFVNGQAKEVTDGQRVGGAPRHCPLRAQSLKVAEQEQTEVPPRRQARPSNPWRIEPAAHALDKRIEAVAIENPIQPLVERMPWARREVARGNPQHVLARSLLLPHRHAREGTLHPSHDRSRVRSQTTFTTGC
jgi:hypothetical protein